MVLRIRSNTEMSEKSWHGHRKLGKTGKNLASQYFFSNEMTLTLGSVQNLERF